MHVAFKACYLSKLAFDRIFKNAFGDKSAPSLVWEMFPLFSLSLNLNVFNRSMNFTRIHQISLPGRPLGFCGSLQCFPSCSLLSSTPEISLLWGPDFTSSWSYFSASHLHLSDIYQVLAPAFVLLSSCAITVEIARWTLLLRAQSVQAMLDNVSLIVQIFHQFILILKHYNSPLTIIYRIWV